MTVIKTMPHKGGMGQPMSGATFAFLIKKPKDTYEAVIPHTTCKDYLNDVLFTEWNNPKVYTHSGLAYSKTDFLDDKMNYLAISAKSNASMKSNIDKNINKIVDIINSFGEMLNIKTKATVKTAECGHHVLSFDAKWNKECYMISMMALIVRASSHWDFKGDFFTFIGDSTITHQDITHMKKVLSGKGQLNFLIENGIVSQNYPKVGQMIHSHGIIQGSIKGFS